MIEVEQKYHIADADALVQELIQLGAQSAGDAEHHQDTYYNHPSRDFAESREAFRVRRIDGRAWITYKGQRLPGAIKARREIEMPIGRDQRDSIEFEDMLVLLSFRRVATVTKSRRTFRLSAGETDAAGNALPPITVAVDRVENLGDFAELEWVAQDESHVEAARQRIERLSGRLSLGDAEQHSYLTLLLQQRPESD
ncbi:class IV adenylate cyclase [Crateriforma conspicua]|uniref:CYTH domain protein n=1 Tax=Crateriforma conspicua TaxID=2527996 RepID=A0A5C6FD46_9PLAN|nr:class IV adenylate cyclase [Crateriforma conspicua]TWU59678.1 CYTH domain protein [Crateriforma conspicua]